MVEPGKSDPGAAKVPSSGTALLILGTIADTTWRMFTPVLGLLIGGMWLDGKTDREPLFTISGVLLGSAIAALLVRLQYKRVQQSDNSNLEGSK